MILREPERVYVFTAQGTGRSPAGGGHEMRPAPALAVPPEFPEAAFAEGIAADDPALDEIREAAEYFSLPALDAERRAIGYYALRGQAPATWKILELRPLLPVLFSAKPRTKSAGGTFAGTDSAAALGRLLRAYHIFQWRQDSRYCGSCGHPNDDAENEVARHCPVCGRTEYPRISPAIIVLITRGENEILLAHNRNFRGGIYSLIAGFAEAGEDLESALRREVREEVDIDVDNIRYVASQSWPFPNSLMIGFSARYRSGEVRPDGAEIEDARWYRRDGLPPLPGNGSVARWLINRWLEGEIPER